MSLSRVAFVLLLCVAAFWLGQRQAERDLWESPCVVSYEQDGKTICEMTERAAALERR